MQIPAETRKTNTFMGQTVDALEWMQSISFLLLYGKRNVLLSTITFYKSILINPSVLRASWSPEYGLQTFLSDPSWVESMRWNGVLPSFVVQWKQDVSVDFISHVWWWGGCKLQNWFLLVKHEGGSVMLLCCRTGAVYFIGKSYWHPHQITTQPSLTLHKTVGGMSPPLSGRTLWACCGVCAGPYALQPAVVSVSSCLNSDPSELESSRFSVEWTNKPACYVTTQRSVQLPWCVRGRKWAGREAQEDSSNDQPSCHWAQTGCGSHAQAGRLITECSG